MRMMGRIVGVRSTEQSVASYLGIFEPITGQKGESKSTRTDIVTEIEIVTK